jgi:hypothetical protein
VPDLEEIRRSIRALFTQSQVVELRAFRGKRVTSGYYDDHEKLAQDAFKLAKRPDVDGVYWTIQKIKTELIGRAYNRYKEWPELTTADAEVERFMWLPVDVDPVRSAGISASEEQKQAAREVSDKVEACLLEQGIGGPRADSGNGFHQLNRIDLPATSENKVLLQRVLAALAAQFNTAEAKIDQTVFNPARIWKVYGSVARKGDDAPGFPHRAARWLTLNGTLTTVTREQLEQIAPATTAYGIAPAKPQQPTEDAPAAMERDLAAAHVAHRQREQYNDGFKWLLENCPFDPSHIAPSIVVTLAADGTRGFKCSHNSCVEKHWRDFRQKAGIRSAFAEPERWENWQQAFHTVEELPEGDIDFLIDQIMPEGINFLGALSGVGKTWFALSMSRALATGKKFLGIWDVAEQANVLYLCPEMNAKAFRRRCERLELTNCARFRCQTISDGAPIDLSNPILAQAIGELRPVVFLDTAIRFSTAEDENAAGQNARGLARGVFNLVHLGARAVNCLHHRSKETASVDEMTLENVLRGTGDFGAMCDTVFGLQYDRGDGTKKYDQESRKLVRLAVRCVKARDFKPVLDFRVQLAGFLNEIHDLGVLAPQDFEALDRAEAERVAAVIEADPEISQTKAAEKCEMGRRHFNTVAARVGYGWDESTGKWRLGNI